MKTFLALATLAAVLAFPGAHAGTLSTADVVAVATMFTDLAAPGVVDTTPLPVLYLDEQGNAWQESNGFDGLQASPLTDDTGAEVAPADTFLAGPSSLPL